VRGVAAIVSGCAPETSRSAIRTPQPCLRGIARPGLVRASPRRPRPVYLIDPHGNGGMDVTPRALLLPLHNPGLPIEEAHAAGRKGAVCAHWP
jgi:hypothetical protein